MTGIARITDQHGVVVSVLGIEKQRRLRRENQAAHLSRIERREDQRLRSVLINLLNSAGGVHRIGRRQIPILFDAREFAVRPDTGNESVFHGRLSGIQTPTPIATGNRRRDRRDAGRRIGQFIHFQQQIPVDLSRLVRPTQRRSEIDEMNQIARHIETGSRHIRSSDQPTPDTRLRRRIAEPTGRQSLGSRIATQSSDRAAHRRHPLVENRSRIQSRRHRLTSLVRDQLHGFVPSILRGQIDQDIVPAKLRIAGRVGK